MIVNLIVSCVALNATQVKATIMVAALNAAGEAGAMQL